MLSNKKNSKEKPNWNKEKLESIKDNTESQTQTNNLQKVKIKIFNWFKRKILISKIKNKTKRVSTLISKKRLKESHNNILKSNKKQIKTLTLLKTNTKKIRNINKNNLNSKKDNSITKQNIFKSKEPNSKKQGVTKSNSKNNKEKNNIKRVKITNNQTTKGRKSNSKKEIQNMDSQNKWHIPHGKPNNNLSNKCSSSLSKVKKYYFDPNLSLFFDY